MAQERMKNMSPQQLADLQRMAANLDPSVARSMGIDPSMMRQAAQQMSQLSPEELRQQAEAVRNMSPDELQRQMSGAQAQTQAQQQYYYKARAAPLSRGGERTAAGVCARGACKTPAPTPEQETSSCSRHRCAASSPGVRVSEERRKQARRVRAVQHQRATHTPQQACGTTRGVGLSHAFRVRSHAQTARASTRRRLRSINAQKRT